MLTASSPPPTANTVRVAVLDDHQLVVDGLTSRLSDPALGMSVVVSVARWGDLLESPEFPVDVVVLDLNLDDTIPIATKVKALSAAGCAVVVISRHADVGSMNSAFQAGARAFVPKTESTDELIAAIRTAAVGSTRMTGIQAEALTIHLDQPKPDVGKQEHRALVLYAGGRSIREVAMEMGTTDETVKSYIKRARRKHREVGLDIGTRILLRRYATEQGWISND